MKSYIRMMVLQWCYVYNFVILLGLCRILQIFCLSLRKEILMSGSEKNNLRNGLDIASSTLRCCQLVKQTQVFSKSVGYILSVSY